VRGYGRGECCSGVIWGGRGRWCGNFGGGYGIWSLEGVLRR